MRFAIVLLCSCVAVVAVPGCSNSSGDTPSTGDPPTSPGYDLTLSSSSLTFAQDWDPTRDPREDFQLVTITYHGDGLIVGYAPGVPPARWLQLTPASAADPRGTELRLATIGWTLAPGVYTTSVRVVTGKLDGSVVIHKDLAVELTVRDTIRLTVDDPSIGGRVGSDRFSNPSTISVSKYGVWTATVDPPWLQLSATASADKQQLTATAIPNTLPAGHHPVTVTITSADQQLSAHVDIDLAIDSLRWWPERQAVALTKTVDRERLSETVQLQATGNVADMGFAAHSDAAWLTASITGGALTLTADPTGLPDGLRLGEVAVTSSANTSTPMQTVRVSLYKLNTAVAGQSTVAVLGAQGVTPFGIVVDPLRPVVYVGADNHSGIEDYNVYTGAQVMATAPAQDHQVLWRVTPDGRQLLTRSYAADTATWGNTIVAYDLDRGTWSAPSTASFDEATQDWIIDGVDLYYHGGFLDPDGHVYRDQGGPGGNVLPFSQLFADPQGTHWLVLQPSGSSVSLDRFTMRVYQLARKLLYFDGGFGGYRIEGPILGVPNVPPPPAHAVLRSRDAYPQFSNQGTEVWVPGGIYAGRLTYDPTYGFGPIFLLNYPSSATSSIQALSVSRNGEAVAIWPGGHSGVMAHYAQNNALTSSEDLSASAPGIAGGASLSAMIKHSADDLRVITVRDSSLTSPAINAIGLMNH